MRGAAIFDFDFPVFDDFYSRASCEARQFSCLLVFTCHNFTHAAPHARRGDCLNTGCTQKPISTHAPHARRGNIYLTRSAYSRFSTHAPHARRGGQQQSDPSPHADDFYSRASCEARPGGTDNLSASFFFSHAPHARRGGIKFHLLSCKRLFYSRAPHARRGIDLINM